MRRKRTFSLVSVSGRSFEWLSDSQLKRVAELESRLASSNTAQTVYEDLSGVPAPQAAQALMEGNARIHVDTTGSYQPAAANPRAVSAHIISDSPQPIAFEAMASSLPYTNPADQFYDWGLGNLFMIPLKWPKNLPAPCEFHVIRTRRSCTG